MRRGKAKSLILVGLQFCLIGFFVWYSNVWGGVVSNILTITALLIGLWAVVTMKFRVSVLPDVQKNQQLYMGGPYKFIRHPMYTAVLVAAFAWTLNRFDMWTIFAWFCLLVVLNVKLKYEENQLLERFSGYKNYSKHTKRLMPGVY